MNSIIASEITALAWRHWLLDRLAGRRDILGGTAVASAVAKRIDRFLIAGLDFVGEPGAEGWPAPTGGRYAKLCFSPLLTQAGGEIPGLHVLPVTLDAYRGYVETITGLAQADAAYLFRLFRFTPAWLFEQCADLRADMPDVWRVLLSNEFLLACRVAPRLLRIVNDSPFRYPLIHGFMIIAEIERAYLIMRHLGRAQAIVDRPKLLDMLSLQLPLRAWLKDAELTELLRWLEYSSFSSTVIRDILFDKKPNEIVGFPKGFGPWAAATGEALSHAATFADDAAVRAVLIRALTPPSLVAAEDAEEAGAR